MKHIASTKHIAFCSLIVLGLALNACTSGSGGGGPGPTPTPPIPSGIFYINLGTGTSNSVAAFSTSQIMSGGQLSALAGSPYQVTGQNGASGAPFGIALAKGGTVLYVVNASQPSLTAFKVNSDSTLSTPPINSYPVGTAPSGVCVDPLSQFAAVVNTTDNTVQSFTIAADGSLTAVTLASSNGLASPAACTFSSDSKFLYVSNNGGSGGISGFMVSVAGVLAKLPASPYDGGFKLQGIVATSSTVFAADQTSNGLQELTISVNGDLISPAAFSTDAGPIGLALSPNGKYLYVAASAKRAVDGYAVAGQALTVLAGSPYTTNATKTAMVTVSAAGNLLVALDEIDDAVTVFAIKSDGTLGFAPTNEYVFGNTGNPMAIIAR
jgi:6-phosphogluconolactonase